MISELLYLIWPNELLEHRYFYGLRIGIYNSFLKKIYNFKK